MAVSVSYWLDQSITFPYCLIMQWCFSQLLPDGNLDQFEDENHLLTIDNMFLACGKIDSYTLKGYCLPAA